MPVDPAQETLPERAARLSRNHFWNERLAAVMSVGLLSLVTILVAFPATDAGDPGPAAWRFWAYRWVPGSLVFWSLAIAFGSRFLPRLRDRDRERDVRLHQAIEVALTQDDATSTHPMNDGSILICESLPLDSALEAHALITGRPLGIAIERLPVGLPGSRPYDACLVVATDGAPTIRCGHRMLASCTSAQLLAVLIHLDNRWRGAGVRLADARTLELTRDPSGLLAAIRLSRSGGIAAGTDLESTIWFSQEDAPLMVEHGVPSDRYGELARHLRDSE